MHYYINNSKKDLKTKKWKKIKVPYNQVPFLLKSPIFCLMNTQDQKINSFKNPFLGLGKMEQGDEQEDDEQGNEKEENSLEECHHH